MSTASASSQLFQALKCHLSELPKILVKHALIFFTSNSTIIRLQKPSLVSVDNNFCN